MNKSFCVFTAVALLASACGGKEPYCCTLKAMGNNQAYTSSARSTWSEIGNAGNEEVCKTEVESEINNNSDFESALAQCADK